MRQGYYHGMWSLTIDFRKFRYRTIQFFIFFNRIIAHSNGLLQQQRSTKVQQHEHKGDSDVKVHKPIWMISMFNFNSLYLQNLVNKSDSKKYP